MATRAETRNGSAVGVAWTTMASPVGRLRLEATARGLSRVVFAASQTATDEPDPEEAPLSARRHLAVARQQFDEYFRAERREFDLPVDLDGVTRFGRAVLRAANAIPRGTVATYGALAQTMGRPRSARAVGGALGRNPVPIVIPCHRVVASREVLGGYAGGSVIKGWLLAFERLASEPRTS